jgi:hypothetical protein
MTEALDGSTSVSLQRRSSKFTAQAEANFARYDRKKKGVITKEDHEKLWHKYYTKQTGGVSAQQIAHIASEWSLIDVNDAGRVTKVEFVELQTLTMKAKLKSDREKVEVERDARKQAQRQERRARKRKEESARRKKEKKDKSRAEQGAVMARARQELEEKEVTDKAEAPATGFLSVFRKKKAPPKVMTEEEILELERLVIRHAESFAREPSLLKELGGGIATPQLAQTLAEMELAEAMRSGKKVKQAKREPGNGNVNWGELLRGNPDISEEDFASELGSAVEGLDSRVGSIVERQEKAMKHIKKSSKVKMKALKELQKEYAFMVEAGAMQKRMQLLMISRLPPRVPASERPAGPLDGAPSPPPSSMGEYSDSEVGDSEIDLDDQD